MTVSAAATRRLRWMNLPGAVLLGLLQRTPAVRVVAMGSSWWAAPPAGTVLRSAIAATAALGATHSLAGATQLVVVPGTSVAGMTGTAITAVAFAVTGANASPTSYRIANLPPGLAVPGASGGVINATSGSISGTPTVAGSFTTTITAFQFNDAQGDIVGPVSVIFLITSPVVAPTLTTQPVSQSANAAATVAFTAAASGTPAPTFQWLKNGAAIAGATNATLTLSSVQTSDAAAYSVVATNAAGSATSSAATLTVNVAPAFTVHPASQTAGVGTSVSLSAAASGTPPPSFQWRLNGAAIAGATGATLTLPNVQLGAAGSYSVMASNVVGSVLSTVATLTVTAGPGIITQPSSQVAVVGTSVAFVAAASGTPSPSFQWFKNGVAITGATGATLTLGSVQSADAASYTVVATNSAGTSTSNAATLTINVGPTLTTQPLSQSASATAAVTFTAAATGSPVPTLQWLKNGAVIAGATNATLTLNNVQAVDAATYAVVATNSAGTTTSSSVTLTINFLPAIAAQPSGQAAGPGGTAVFSVRATGTGPLSYQWFKDGVSLGVGATSASLALVSVQSADAGSYSVRVTNPAGVITSAAAALSVVPPNPGRIINLSILTTVTAADSSFTVGTVIGGAGTNGGKPLVIRAVGPSLTPLGVGDALPDPDLTVLNGQTQVAANDNWGSGAAPLSAAFAQVGAFAFASITSRDAAVAFNPLIAPPASYTMQVRGNGTFGTVLAELYDATPGAAYTAATPRLINVSVLKQIPAGTTLTAGFVIGGATSRQVLVRAIGPTLGTAFGVGGVMADPKIDLFDGSQKNIDSNNDWGGTTALAAAFASVGAFTLPVASKDAALVILLAPGNYTAVVGGTGGFALVEVYEVP